MFRGLPPATKNLLILNILFYFATVVFSSKGIDLTRLLGAHYAGTVFFEPYQVITYMFMHSIVNPMHILFNMLLLFMFGAHLEVIWGTKRFFTFYIACGLGGYALYNAIGVWEIMQLKELIIADGYDIDIINNLIQSGMIEQIPIHSNRSQILLETYIAYNLSTMIGASGAIFGLLAGFAVLFPNVQLMLLFPPIPVRAKYLIGAYLAYEIYASFYAVGDSIAHIAHVGGALVGIILVLIWRKKDKRRFY